MDLAIARRLIAELPTTSLVVDIGGGASPFPRADYVVDAVPFDDRGTGSAGNVHQLPGASQRFGRDTWVQVDICNCQPWPFRDKKFDFAICSHLLEDIRDPIWVCSELCRIAKAGYIEVPSRIVEQSLGIEHPRYAGYYHHRWLVTLKDERLEFRHKPHSLHTINDAIVTRLAPGRRINPKYEFLAFEWNGSFEFREVCQFSEDLVNDELCDFARIARELPELTIGVPMSIRARLGRHIYFRRLAKGRRA